MYNQLLKDKNRLRQERNAQKESILKMKRALTYVKGQVAKLQAKQRCEPTPQPPPNN